MNTPLHNQPTLYNLSTRIEHLLGDTTIIGRHEDCNLVLKSERGASRKHARITIENNAAILMDLGSLNGTMVNGREISRAVQLSDGDIIIFDEHEYQFIAPNTPAQNSGENVTVIANKDEIGRPEKIKPAIRVVEPSQPTNTGGNDHIHSLDDTEAWQVPDVGLEDDYSAIPATSRPGGDAPTPKRQRDEPTNPRNHIKPKAKLVRWFLLIPIIILLVLIAFYFAYTTGFTAGNLSGSTGSP